VHSHHNISSYDIITHIYQNNSHSKQKEQAGHPTKRIKEQAGHPTKKMKEQAGHPT